MIHNESSLESLDPLASSHSICPIAFEFNLDVSSQRLIKLVKATNLGDHPSFSIAT